jgi:uncharacterized membrane protein
MSCLTSVDAGSAGADATISAVAELKGVRSLNAINRHNQMVGAAECDGNFRAVIVEDGVERDLLEGENHYSSEAVDINDNGVVIGGLSLEPPENGLSRSLPFVWNNGVLTVIRDIPRGGALRINNRNQVLMLGENAIEGGYLWEAGVVTALGSMVVPRDINELGQIVGELYGTSPAANVGFLWEQGVLTELPAFSTANAINDKGQIAGVSRAGRPVLWDGEDLIELPVPSSQPGKILSDGTVLGDSWVYTDGAVSHLVGKVGRDAFFDNWALDLNEAGVIVGGGSILRFTGGSSCQLEACEIWEDHAVVWSFGCFNSCCGDTAGAGGAGGAGGTGSTP